MAVYNEQIIDWLKPVTQWLHDQSGGWLVLIAVLFVISFPPLFGHEIVAILCGVVWGLWIGFGIVAVGTLFGEIANYFVFKYWCRARGEKKSIFYACLARVIREGGFIIVVIVRLGAVPAHFTTPVFATCGMNVFIFTLAAILTMPKQLIFIYIGVILEQSADGTESSQSHKISNIVLIVTILLTILAMLYIRYQVRKVQPDVIYQRRKARQAKPEGQLNAQQSSELGPSNGWEIYQGQADLYPADGLGILLRHGGFVPDIHPTQLTVLPASIKDELLSAISDASSIISPAAAGSASPERIHCLDHLALTHPRKQSWNDCAFSVKPSRKRSTSDAFFPCQTIPGAEPPYGDFLVSSSYLPLPEPANHYRQTHLTSPQSNIWPQPYTHSGSSTGLSGQFGTSYDYPSWGSYDGYGQGCFPTEGVIDNGQTSVGGGHFKAEVASLAVQKAAWKKRKNSDGRIFGCRCCGAHLTTKQDLTYHISAHLNKRDYACGKCNKRFTTPHVRTRHEIRCRNQEPPNV